MLIFAVAVIGSGGVFFYKLMLNRNIADSEAYLKQREKALEPATIEQLVRTDKRLRAADELLGSHTVLTPVFSMLEDLTLKSVRITKLDFANSSEKGPVIKIAGEARSYGSVAYQADLLNNYKQFIKSAVFSNLNLDDKGNVTFDAVISLDPDLINYKKEIAREGSPAPAQ